MENHVTLQVAGGGERLATLGTGKRLVSCMDHHVCPQANGQGESLATVRTTIELSMGPLVFVQCTGLRERLVTLGTGIGFLSCMGSLVALQMMRKRESLTTVGTGIRVFS